jgi:uncharacterized membrane protein (UPF0127 family)
MFLILALAFACTSQTTQTTPRCPFPSTASFSPRTQLHVDIASDDATRERGLMGVTDLGSDDGMAFVWDSPTDATFWMKDTLIPLSIAFVGQDGRVISIREMTPCTADPCETYGADAPYTTALEANANWFEDHHVEVSDPMTLSSAGCTS